MAGGSAMWLMLGPVQMFWTPSRSECLLCGGLWCGEQGSVIPFQFYSGAELWSVRSHAHLMNFSREMGNQRHCISLETMGQYSPGFVLHSSS